VRIAHDPLNRYLLQSPKRRVIGRRHDVERLRGYGKMIEQLKADSFESNLASGAAWVGTPKQIVKQINAYRRDVGNSRSPHCK